MKALSGMQNGLPVLRGVSLSEMVSGYFQAVCKGKAVKIEATPVLAEISGVLSPQADSEKAYCRLP
ncbi:MAG: hypothetical protein MZV70_21140 [Desulfobacterales bacterium]|nr:hypothetical protein [Desulfobacterales bacterium]